MNRESCPYACGPLSKGLKMKNLVPVNFHGAKLYGAKIGGATLIAVKPVVTAMGLSWHGHLERIKRDPVIAEGIRVIRIPSKSGEQETVCLPLTLIPVSYT